MRNKLKERAPPTGAFKNTSIGLLLEWKGLAQQRPCECVTQTV